MDRARRFGDNFGDAFKRVYIGTVSMTLLIFNLIKDLERIET